MTRPGSFPIEDAPGNLFARVIRETPKGGIWFKLTIDDGVTSEDLPEMLYAESLFDIPAACRAALN